MPEMTSAPMPRLIRRSTIAGLVALTALAFALALAPVVLAHGGPTPPEPTIVGFLTAWSLDPLLQASVVGGTALYLLAVRRVDRAHPANPVPRARIVAFLAGMLALEVALQSGIERYDTTLFSVHMVQHMLLTMVAAPLIVLGAPITLVLRVSTPAVRRRWVLPVLHSRVVRVVGHPVVAWLLFTAVMWGSHFTPLFDAALENEWLHDAEHMLYLSVGLLFWWPVVGLDPSPYRMSYPARILYLFLQMPQNTFLALAVYSASAPLYAHYVTSGRPWGPSPLVDQQAAGAIMWVWGDLTFLLALLLMLAAWMRDEEARTRRREVRIDAERAALREREATLAIAWRPRRRGVRRPEPLAREGLAPARLATHGRAQPTGRHSGQPRAGIGASR
jgi:putative copper resistance protein D